MNPKERRRSTVSNEPELTVLNTLISATHKWTDTKDVLSTALEQVAKLSDADGAECHLVNSVGELQFTAQYNLDTDFVTGSQDIRFPLRVGLPGRAYASQSAIFVPDITSEEHYLRKNLATQAGYRSLVCIPLSGMDTLLGTFTLYYREKIQPITDLRDILTTIGKQMGIAVERARLFQQNTEQLYELQVLQTIANALNRSADIQDALERSLEAVASVINLVCGWVVLLDDAEGVRLAASYKLPPELNAEQWASMKAPCFCLKLLKEGQLKSAINIVECQQLKTIADLNYPHLHHASIPIHSGNIPLGNLNLVPSPDSPFTEGQLRLFTAIGEQIGVAVERAFLHEEVKAQRVKEQAALLKLSQTLLGLLDRQSIAEAAFAAVQKYLPCDSISLLLPGDNAKHFELVAGDGWTHEYVGRLQLPLEPLETSCIAQVMQTRQPVLVDITKTDQPFEVPAIIRQSGVKNCLNIPMLADERAIGVLVVDSFTPRTFSQDEIRFLSLLANQVAQALERARIFEAEHNQRKLAESLSKALAAGAELSRTLELDRLLEMLLDQAASVVPYDAANVMLVEGKRIRVANAKGYDHVAMREIVALSMEIEKTPNLRHIVTNGKPIVVPDTSQDPDWIALEGISHFHSWAGVPIIIQGQVAIIFSLDKKEADFYQLQHIPLLEAFAGQAALAVQNAHSYEAEKRRAQETETLWQIGSVVISTLDQNEAIQRVLEQLERVVPYDTASVQLLRDDYLEIVGGRGWSEDELVLGLRFPVPGDNPNTIVIQERRPHILGNAQSAHAPFGSGPHRHIQSWLGVPLIVHERVIGMLAVDNTQPDYFNDGHAKLISAFANQVAISIENTRMVEALRSSEALYKSLFDGVPVGLFRTTPGGKILDVNLALVKMLGYPDQMALKALSAVDLYVSSEDRQRFRNILTDHGIVRDFQVQLKHFTDQKIWALVNAQSTLDDQGSVRYFDGIAQDITAQHKAEEQLRSSEERFRTLVQDSSDMIAILDRRGNIRYVSDSISRILGYSPEEVLRRNTLRFIHRDDFELSTSLFANLIQDPVSSATLQYRFRHKDGSWRVIESTGTNLYSNPAIAGILLNSRDITERAQAEAKLRELKEFNEHIIQTMSEGIVLQDEEGYFIFANPAAEVMLGYSPGELTGQHWTAIVPEEQHSIVEEADERRKQGIADGYEIECLRKDGSQFSVFLSGSPRYDGKEFLGFLVVFTDISPIKEREKAQIRRTKELEILAELSSNLRNAHTVAEMFPSILRQATEIVDGHVSTIYLEDPKTHELVLKGAYPENMERLGARHQFGEGITGHVAASGELYICDDFKNDPLAHILPEDETVIEEVIGSISVPLLLNEGRILGVMNIGLVHSPQISQEEISLLTAIAELAGNAIQRASLHEQTERHLQQISALREIDTAISASLDLRLTLHILLEQVTTQLKVDAVAVSLLDTATQTLQFKAGRGFLNRWIEETSLRLGQGKAGLAALEKRIVHIPDLTEIGDQFLRTKLVENEKFISYYALPLIAKGEVKGVLEIFHRSLLDPPVDWLDFLKTVSVQTAIAIKPRA